MRRQFRWDKKYLNWGITAFLVIAGAILFYMALSYLPVIGKGLGTLLRILSPFVWGLVITYLLHPLMKALERSAFLPLSRRLYKGKRAYSARRFARGMSVLMAEIVLIAAIVALFYLILPQLYGSIVMIVDNSPTYIANLTAWVEKTLKGFPELEAYITEALTNVNTQHPPAGAGQRRQQRDDRRGLRGQGGVQSDHRHYRVRLYSREYRGLCRRRPPPQLQPLRHRERRKDPGPAGLHG